MSGTEDLDSLKRDVLVDSYFLHIYIYIYVCVCVSHLLNFYMPNVVLFDIKYFIFYLA